MTSGFNKMRSASVSQKSKRGKDVSRSTSHVRSHEESKLKKNKIPIQRSKKRDKKTNKRVIYELDDECCLPFELVIEILLRLPVKSLGRFKSVCKSWNTLISSHHFAQSHLKHNNNASHLLFQVEKNSYSFSLTCKDNSTRFMSSPIDAFFEVGGNITVLPMNSRCIQGTIDGLIWVQSYDQIIHILNPITKECRDIPLPKVKPRHQRRHAFYSACGFGFFPLMEDYKLVRITCDVDVSSFNVTKIQVRIFSLRNDHWRVLNISAFDTSIDHYAFFYEANHGVVLLNDAFYWVVPCNYRYIGGFMVLKFNVIKETLSSMVNIKGRDAYRRIIGFHFRKLSIGVIGDDLCVCQLPVANSPTFIDMWKLKTEEGQGDWELLFRIGLESQFPRRLPNLLGFVRNGNIFLQVHGDGDEKPQVWLFDPNGDTPTYKLFMEERASYVTNFVASLVSPYQGESSNGISKVF